MVFGDMNATADTSACLAAVLGSGRWVDLHVESAKREGREQEGTCRATPTSEPTRIDMIVGNRSASAAMKSCRMVRTVFPVHDAVLAVFDWKILAEEGWGPRPGRPLLSSKALGEHLQACGPVIQQARWESELARGGAAALELWHWESEIAIKEVLYKGRIHSLF